MSVTQYIHVYQFFLTVFTFSILFPIGQRLIMMITKSDQRFSKQKLRQYENQIKWQQLNQVKKNKTTQPDQEIDESKRKQQQKRAIQEARKTLDQQRIKQKSLQQQNLRESLVADQNQTTDRKLQEYKQDIPVQSRKSVQKRKSLTQLSQYNEQEPNTKEIEIKDEETIKDKSSRAESFFDENKDEKKKNTQGFGNFQLGQKQQQHVHEESIHPSQFGAQEEVSSRQIKMRQKMGYFMKLDTTFSQYIPVLISTIVLGMLTQSTYIFSMVCFFGYLFMSLLLNYADLLSSIKSKSPQPSIFSKIQRLTSGLFIIALFIDYWTDSQYQ